jgi:hypothetical protein
MYGTADQSEKSEARQQADRYRAITRLSTAFSNSTTLTSAVASHQTNATPLDMAGGLCATSAKRPRRPCKFRGRSQSQNRQVCLTQTWPRWLQSEWEGEPRPHACSATCHGAGTILEEKASGRTRSRIVELASPELVRHCNAVRAGDAGTGLTARLDSSRELPDGDVPKRSGELEYGECVGRQLYSHEGFRELSRSQSQ